MTQKLELKEVMAAVDLNARSMWDDLSEDEQKKVKKELFILNRFISNAKTSNREQMEHFVLTVNEYYNKNWFDLQKHPKLLWLLLCMCSYNGEKIFYHEWIGLGKRVSTTRTKLLEEVYPNLKNDEIDTLLGISTDDELKELARDLGWSDKEIKNL
jgi:superfamily I DNA and/or RNA helicase